VPAAAVAVATEESAAVAVRLSKKLGSIKVVTSFCKVVRSVPMDWYEVFSVWRAVCCAFICVSGAFSMVTNSLMMEVQSRPEARPDKVEALLLEVAAMDINSYSFF